MVKSSEHGTRTASGNLAPLVCHPVQLGNKRFLLNVSSYLLELAVKQWPTHRECLTDRKICMQLRKHLSLVLCVCEGRGHSLLHTSDATS